MAHTSIGGGRLYLFSKPGNTKLIVTAHGGKRTNRFSPPQGALLWFCSVHGQSTATDADDLVAVITGDRKRQDKVRAAGFHPHPVGDITDYDLSKFAGKHGGGQYENYAQYEKFAGKGVDIVSPRHRWFSDEVTLSFVLGLSEINSKGYKNIYCSFCRS